VSSDEPVSGTPQSLLQINGLLLMSGSTTLAHYTFLCFSKS